MQPTNKLRFVESEAREYYGDGFARVFKNRVLQQLWESTTDIDTITGKPVVEWRDVPLEVEHADG